MLLYGVRGCGLPGEAGKRPVLKVEGPVPEADSIVWTVETTALLVGLSRSRIRHLLAAGRFPGAFKIGRYWLIPDADLKAYMAHPDRRRKDVPRQGELPGVEKLRRIQ